MLASLNRRAKPALILAAITVAGLTVAPVAARGLPGHAPQARQGSVPIGARELRGSGNEADARQARRRSQERRAGGSRAPAPADAVAEAGLDPDSQEGPDATDTGDLHTGDLVEGVLYPVVDSEDEEEDPGE